VYPGAEAEQVQSFVTTPLQEVMAAVEGVDYITSSSADGISIISVNLTSGYDANEAMAEITALIAPVKNQFPRTVEYPEIVKSSAALGAGLYLQAWSDTYTLEQLTDYMDRVVKPEILTLSSVGGVVVYGAREFSMRLWLDPVQMAAFDISVEEFHSAVTEGTFQTPAGEIESERTTIKVKADTELSTVEDFENIVIRQQGDERVRVKDVARVELGAASDATSVFFKGKRGLSLVECVPGNSQKARGGRETVARGGACGGEF